MSVELIHSATAVAIDGRAMLLEGPPGKGKSTLALQLIDRGAVLIGDDAVSLGIREERLWVSPPPNISGKLEVRNVGIVELPVTIAPLAIVLRLTAAAPRFADTADDCVIAGHCVPCLAFDPSIAAAPLRAEWALRQYGLPL